MKRVYLLLALLGAAVPLYFFIGYFAEQGFDVQLFWQSLTANKAAAGGTADLLLSAFIFWGVMWRDARRLQIDKVWLVVAGTCLIGLSFALPLYLYFREAQLEAQKV